MRVVVTGGGTGIGLAAARRFVSDGHEVVLIGRRPAVLAAAVTELGDSASCLVGDATQPDDVAAFADQLGDGVDVLVCSAGGLGASTGDGLEATAQRWRSAFELNLLSAVLITEALLPLMPRPGGRVIAVSSVSGRKGAGSYGAAKAALNMWTIDLAGELAAEGITVNAVAPGYVPDTGFWDGRRDDAEVQARLAKVAMRRAGEPSEVADAIAYLASAGAGFTTGQILGIDGGTLLAL